MEKLQLPDDFDLANILWEIKKKMAEGENDASSEHSGTESQVQSGESNGGQQATQSGGSGIDGEGGDTSTGKPEITTVTPSESAIPTPPEHFGDPGDFQPVAKKSGERTRFKRHFARSTNK